MNRLNRGVVFAAAAAAIFAMGCGGTTDTDAGTNCTTDSNCGTGKGCHPVLKTCVTTCTSGSDCPASEKTCAKVNNSTSTFCTCATDALCNSAVPGNVCNLATLQCGGKCTSSANCPSGSTCNTTSGVCSATGSTDAGTDGGTDAGTDAGIACTGLGTCTYPEVCDFTTSRCGTKACTGGTAQPAECGYAGYCTTANNCNQVAPATCGNFTGANAPVFNPTTSTGPVIFFVDTDATPSAAFCFKGQFVHGAYLDVYRTDRNWDATLAGEQDTLRYLNSAGTPTTLGAGAVPGSYYVPNGKALRQRVALCAYQQASITAGFKYVGGSEACFPTSNSVAGSTSCTGNADCGTGHTCNTGTGTCS